MNCKIIAVGLLVVVSQLCWIALGAAIAVPDVLGDTIKVESKSSVEDAAARDAADGKTSDLTGSASNLAGILQPVTQPKIQESARLETEGLPSKVLSTYDNSQSKVTDFLHPKPIVDTIQEHEKYGNNGDKFYPIGRAIVNGYEGFANILNKILDTPVEVAKTFSRGLTNTLNAVGGKIVGL